MKRLISVLLAVIMVLAMSSSVFAASVSSAGAQNIALRNAKLKKSQVTGLRTKLDRKDKRYDVDFRNKKNGTKFSYEIGQKNGRVYEKSIGYKYKRNYSKKKISKASAQSTASRWSGVRLAVVKKGKCKYEYDDGEGIYEVKFRNGRYKYEIEIQAPTGKVIEYSWEYK